MKELLEESPFLGGYQPNSEEEFILNRMNCLFVCCGVIFPTKFKYNCQQLIYDDF
jgi:hypothetical protein